MGFDYKVTKDFTFSAAYSYTDAKIKDNLYSEKDYHQQLSGTALTWQPNNWYIVGTASYYKDYVPSTRQRTLSHFFAGDGYGLEGFVGYTFNIDKPFLKSIQPYVAADSLRLKGTRRIMPTTFTSARAPPSVMVCRCMWSARWPTAATMSRTPPGLRCSTTSDSHLLQAGVCAGFSHGNCAAQGLSRGVALCQVARRRFAYRLSEHGDEAAGAS